MCIKCKYHSLTHCRSLHLKKRTKRVKLKSYIALPLQYTAGCAIRRDLRKKNDGLDQDGSEQSRVIQPVAKITVTTHLKC